MTSATGVAGGAALSASLAVASGRTSPKSQVSGGKSGTEAASGGSASTQTSVTINANGSITTTVSTPAGVVISASTTNPGTAANSAAPQGQTKPGSLLSLSS